MDRKAKVHFESTLTMLSTSDMFVISMAERQHRLIDFLNALKSLHPEQYGKASFAKAEEKWRDFHRKLSDYGPRGEYLHCFMNSVLRCDEAFVNYNLGIYNVLSNLDMPANKIFEVLEDRTSKNMLIRALKENCQNVPTNMTHKYLLVRVMPAIFSPQTSDDERKELCELVLSLPMGFAVEYMHKDAQQKYKEDVINTFIPFISFRLHWCLMCKTLIHFSGKMLHTDTTLQNGILKIAEEAFKSSAVENRCAAFDCWMVMIDNYALEMKYLMIPKQTALLLKPLRARISRNPNVAAKKFDTLVYLLRKARFPSDLLEKYLIDAFGPFEIEIAKDPKYDSVHYTRELRASYPVSTEILLKALRHDKTKCGCANKLPFRDTCGVIEGEVKTWEVLVESVRLCVQLNYQSFLDRRREITETVTKCLWSSLFKYNQQNVALKPVQEAIAQLLKSPLMSSNFYDRVFKHVLTSVVDYLDNIKFDTHVYEVLVLPTIKELIIFQHEHALDNFLPQCIYEDVRQIFGWCTSDPNFFDTVNSLMQRGWYKCQLASDVFSFALHHWSNTMGNDPSKEHEEILMKLFTHFIIANCGTNVFPKLLSPITVLLSCKSDAVVEVINKLKDDASAGVGLLKVTSMLLRSIITPQKITDHVLYSSLLSVISDCIQNLCIAYKSQNLDILQDSTKTLLDSFSALIGLRGQQPKLKMETYKLLYISYLLLHLGNYSMMDLLMELMAYVEKSDLPNELYEIISNLTDCKAEEISQKAFAVFAKLHALGPNSSSSRKDKASTNGHENGLGSAKNAPKIKILSNIPVVPSVTNTVRLFGASLESPSPKRSRGSVLEHTKTITASVKNSPSTTPSISTFSKELRNIDDLSEGAFVVVDKEVVVDKGKMNEHQLEVLNKRREDIPALYQDCTQSQSGSEQRMATTLSPKNLLSDLDAVDAEDDSIIKVKSPDVSKRTATEEKERGRKRKSRNSTESSPKIAQNDKKPCTESVSAEQQPEKDANAQAVASDVDKDDARPKVVESKKMATEIRKLTKIDIVGVDDYFNKPRTRRSRGVHPSNDHSTKPKTNDAIKEKDDSEKNDVTSSAEKNTKPLGRRRGRKSKLNVSNEEENTDKNTNEETAKSDNENQNKSEESEKVNDAQSEMECDLKQKSPKQQAEGTPESTNEAVNVGKKSKSTDSESIIPSSQESPRVNLFRLPHYSPTKKELEEAKSRNEKIPLINSTVMSKIDFADLAKDNDKKEKVDAENKNDETMTLDVLDDVPEGANVADMDTESFMTDNTSMHLLAESLSGDGEDDGMTATDPMTTPVRVTRNNSRSSLEASPIMHDTPVRTKELLDNTLNISPIKNVSKGGVASECSADLFGTQGSQDQNRLDVDCGNDDLGNNVDDMQAFFKPEENTSTLKNAGSRSAKLLNLIGQSPKVSTSKTVLENVKTVTVSSPRTDRIKKMMQFCTDSKTPEAQDLAKGYPGDVLEFERVVPSPLALPKSSILKRKFEVLDSSMDGISPCAKKKRVNFSDPPTTCEKVYFKEIQESEKPIALRKQKRSSRKLANENETSEAQTQVGGNDGSGASSAIKSMQSQIDGLELDGVAPLESSPPKHKPESDDRLLDLPSNAAPELTGAVLRTGYDDLFPNNGEQQRKSPSPPPPPSQSSKERSDWSNKMEPLWKSVIETARGMNETESLLNVFFQELPTNVIKKWLKDREDREKEMETNSR